jgi:hypothetical protein
VHDRRRRAFPPARQEALDPSGKTTAPALDPNAPAERIEPHYASLINHAGQIAILKKIS